MVRELEVTDQAYDDLLEIWKYVARYNEPAANRLAEKIEKAYKSLPRFPFKGAIRDDLGVNVRSYPVGNYVMYYEVDDDKVSVVRVIHGARDIQSLEGN